MSEENRGALPSITRRELGIAAAASTAGWFSIFIGRKMGLARGVLEPSHDELHGLPLKTLQQLRSAASTLNGYDVPRPTFEEERSVVKINIPGLEPHRGLDPHESIPIIRQQLEIWRNAIEADNTADTHPHLSLLSWYKNIDGIPFFNNADLLEMLDLFIHDIDADIVQFYVDSTDFGGAMHVSNELNRHDDGYYAISRTNIGLNPEIQHWSYPDLIDKESIVEHSSLDTMLLALYEYTNRLATIGNISELYNQTDLDITRIPPQQMRKVIGAYMSLKKEYGSPQSTQQNFVQLAATRSLAALAGDPNGKLVGTERNQNWPPYQYYVAALNGNTNALIGLDRLLNQGVGY